VRRLPTFLDLIKICHHRVTGKSFERQRRDKSLRIGRHDHMDLAAPFDQQTGQIDRFVGRDRTGYSQNDDFAFCHVCPSLSPDSVPSQGRDCNVTRLQRGACSGQQCKSLPADQLRSLIFCNLPPSFLLI